MNYTKNYAMNLPEESDCIQISMLNENFRMIDKAVSFLMKVCGFENGIKYKVGSAFVDVGTVEKTSASHYFIMKNVEVECRINIGETEIFTTDPGGFTIYTDMEVYPFGKYGQWQAKTDIDVCVCAEYNIYNNACTFVAYSRQETVNGTDSLTDLEPIMLNSSTILFPIGHFKMDTNSSSVEAIYPAESYDSSNLKTITIE